MAHGGEQLLKKAAPPTGVVLPSIFQRTSNKSFEQGVAWSQPSPGQPPCGRANPGPPGKRFLIGCRFYFLDKRFAHFRCSQLHFPVDKYSPQSLSSAHL